MELDGQEYNAALPFDLFRANEAVNAVKRRHVKNMLDSQTELHIPVPEDPEARTRELQLLFVRLMNEGAIVLYDTDLAILAHNGYGKDDIVNNTVLPDDLSYLSR